MAVYIWNILMLQSLPSSATEIASTGEPRTKMKHCLQRKIMQASPEIQRRAACLPSVYRRSLDWRLILVLLHKRLCGVNSAVLYSTINLMLFSGKTMALPQQSVSCQLFVTRQYQSSALFLFPAFLPHFVQKEFLNARAGTEGQILSCWNQWAFWQWQEFNEGLHGSMPQGAAVSWMHPKSSLDIWSHTTTPMGSQQKMQCSAENGLLSSLVFSTLHFWYPQEIPFCPPLVLLPSVPLR